jgi:hypothetical protein
MVCTLFLRNNNHTFSLLSTFLYKKTGVCPLLGCIAVVVTRHRNKVTGQRRIVTRQRKIVTRQRKIVTRQRKIVARHRNIRKASFAN